MSLWRDDLKPSRATIGAVVALGAVGIASLDRAFQSPKYLLWAIPATAIGAAFALSIGRLSLGGSFALLAAAGALTLPVLFAHSLTTYGFPTASAYRYIGTLWTSGLGGVVREAAPVPVDPRYLVVVWTSALGLGFLGAAWIVVARPIGAVVTGLGVVAFAGSVGAGDGRWLYSLGAVVCALAFFLADGRLRISVWGRKTSMPAMLGIPTLLAASIVSLAAPTLLNADSPLLNLESALRSRVVIIKPLSDIQRQLRIDPPIEIMRVRSPKGAYWRLTALDTYDGKEWFLEARPVPAQNGPIKPPDPPTTGDELRQEFRITSLSAPWLPAAYSADRIDTPVPFELDEASHTLLVKGQTVPGMRYAVRSRLPQGPSDSPQDLDPSGDDRERIFAGYARPIVGGADSPYQMAVALERHFRTYRYDDKIVGGHTVARLERFLREKVGFCEQFAATMTLMLRGLGVEARVAVGSLPGGRSNNEFIVSTRDLHAWVEVKLPNLGWTTFDPTPGRGRATAPNSPAEQEASSTPIPVPQASFQPQPTPALRPSESEPVTADNGFPRRVLAGVLALAVLSSPAAAKTLRRRMRRNGAPPEAALGAFAELVDRAADLGYRTKVSETQREFYRRVFAALPSPGSDAAAVVAQLAALSLYGARPVLRQEATTSWQSVPAALSGLRSATPWYRRLRAFFDPLTLVRADAFRGRVARIRPRAAPGTPV